MPVTDVYPEIEPFDHGELEVGDGNLVYWETCGNPKGKPAVVFHGGPGSGCSPWFRTLFDPRELPVGILTALIGGPVFALIMLRNRRMS